MKYSEVQYSTVQYSTVQYSTVQYSTVQYSTVQYSTVQYSTVQYSTVQTVQYSTELKPVMDLREVTLSETYKIINKLGNSLARGNDEIETQAVKVGINPLLKPINYIMNLSIRKITFPMKWKIGKVLGKLSERAVQLQMSRYMEREKLWHPNQHAYRKFHSVAMALTQISDNIFEAAEDREITAAMTVDKSSAFNCIDHQILIEKIRKYGFNEKTTNWTLNYLI